MDNPYQTIYAIARRIPTGRVSSYGRVAALAGYPRHARMVGYALFALRDSAEHRTVPWWRVVNAAGRISNGYQPELQRALLDAEGVAFDARGYVDLRVYLWDGDEE